jgi:hypothetical protein
VTLLRNPVFAAGLVLLLLGAGNWVVAYTHLIEFRDPPPDDESDATVGTFDEFGELDAHTNADLLRPLRQGIGARAVTDAKADFYKVVQAGGQLFFFAGFGLVLFASASVWRSRRGLPLTAIPH